MSVARLAAGGGTGGTGGTRELEDEMALTRRRFILAAVLAPLGAAATSAAATTGATVASAAPAFRPARRGTSTGACARCGGGDNAMLDPRCPAATPVTAPPLARRGSPGPGIRE